MTSASGIVDSHVHLLPDRLARKIRAFFDQHMPGGLAFPLDHDIILERLFQNGITTVWSLPYAHKGGVAAGMNASLAEIARRHENGPVTVVGGATVHPLDDDPALVIRQALDTYGLKVLKLHCSVGDFVADDPRFNPVWEVVSERRMPVIIHVGHDVSGYTHSTELDPIERVAQAFPLARIIIAHCGHEASTRALDLVEQYPSIYADLTPVVTEPVAAPAWRLNRLADKLLFGSDAPNVVMTTEQCLAHIHSLNLTPTAQAAILGGTARRLLGEVG